MTKRPLSPWDAPISHHTSCKLRLFSPSVNHPKHDKALGFWPNGGVPYCKQTSLINYIIRSGSFPGAGQQPRLTSQHINFKSKLSNRISTQLCRRCTLSCFYDDAITGSCSYLDNSAAHFILDYRKSSSMIRMAMVLMQKPKKKLIWRLGVNYYAESPLLSALLNYSSLGFIQAVFYSHYDLKRQQNITLSRLFSRVSTALWIQEEACVMVATNNYATRQKTGL